MHGEDIEQAGDGEHPKHLPPRGGQQQVTPGVPGVLPRTHKGCQAAGVDEPQGRQIDDDPRLAGRDRRERSRGPRGVNYVKLAAQHDDDVTITVAGTQIQVEHEAAFLLQQQGGVWTQRLIRQHFPRHYTELPPLSLPACGATPGQPAGLP